MGISQRKLHAEQRCLADLFLIFIITTILGTLWYSTWCLSHFFFFLAWNKASFIAQKGGGGGRVRNPWNLPLATALKDFDLDSFTAERLFFSELTLQPSQQHFLKNFQVNLHFTYYTQGKYEVRNHKLCIYKCAIDVLYIFDRVFKKNIIGKCARSSTGNFSANCCHVLSRFYLWERIHDPVSVTWIAFNGKLMGFRIKIFKKQFVCLLFSVCSFITLVEKMIAQVLSVNLRSAFLLHASLLRRCQRIYTSFTFEFSNYWISFENMLLVILDRK